jgi:hypothetical protein
MSSASQLVLLAFAVVVSFYLHAFVRFYRLAKAERPEWLNIRGAFTFLFGGDPLPGLGDPNIQAEIIRIAFGSRVRELHSPAAAAYARRIRVLGCVAVALFVAGITGLLASAP